MAKEKMSSGSKAYPKENMSAKGAAKGMASPGGEDDSEKLGQAKDQYTGPKSSKLTVQPAADDNMDEALAMRGMSSADSAKFWKGTGYKVPTNQAGEYTKARK